jgi:quinol monooxygenase YgiN
MAYVIIVELRAKPDRVAEFAELIDRHAHNSRALEEGCLAFPPPAPRRIVLPAGRFA